MSSSGSSPVVSESARALQENLHILLTRLSATFDHVKNWPEAKGDSDDASVHVESTSKLIANVRQVVAALEKVEGSVKADKELRRSLQDCQIPLDLLDLLDSNLNPDCFSRGLVREALGQLAGLQRRKLALSLLGAAVQSGLNKRLAEEKAGSSSSTAAPAAGEGKKRSRSEDDDSAEPARKKQHVS